MNRHVDVTFDVDKLGLKRVWRNGICQLLAVFAIKWIDDPHFREMKQKFLRGESSSNARGGRRIRTPLREQSARLGWSEKTGAAK